jgi:histidyl-tRNA synthetase
MVDALSGFPEWLPEQELVQQRVLDVVREQFELHGFVAIRTRSVERVEDLLSQGETDKEIYGLHRLAAEPSDDAGRGLALHYDLTVPFARYVAEHRGQLTFPFRRHQIQPAWRGERPQLGRYREFIQADADIIGNGKLDPRHDSDLVGLLRSTLDRLPVPPVKLLVNNRKILEGFYRGLGIEDNDVTGTLRLVDKLPKIGPDKLVDLLVRAGRSDAQAKACIALAGLELRGADEIEKVRALGVTHPLLEQGLAELGRLLTDVGRPALPGGHPQTPGLLGGHPQTPGSVVGALHIARGFDYYTGTVVEGVLQDHPELGSVCSGGRYDNLASMGSGQPLPGVGISIGITRLLAYCFHLGLLKQKRRSPAQVLVVVHSEEERGLSDALAARLRIRGIPCLVSDSAAAYGKQIKAADQLGIPYLWFPAQGDRPDLVKDMQSGVQGPAAPDTWTPSQAAIGLVFLDQAPGKPAA